MQLTNIYNRKNVIYLFIRNNEGALKVRKISDFYPYYFEPDEQGVYKGYDLKRLRKVIVSLPKEIPMQRSNESYESDVRFCQRYVIDKIEKFDKYPIKYCMLDIEILVPEGKFPEPTEAKYPISCITIYNSMYDKFRTWFLGDYNRTNKDKEGQLMLDFITYFRKAKFDIIFGFNVDRFDYAYLYNRLAKLPQKYYFDKISKYNNFATVISPIGMVRSGNREFDNFFPAGTSIIDYREWIRKIVKGLKAYSLDNCAKEILGKGKLLKNKDVDFSTINEGVRERNIQDVKLMVEIENKLHLIEHYDEIRRFSQISWEDFKYPMRIIESPLLKKARSKGMILPMKKQATKKGFEGAIRDVNTGLYADVIEYDLSGAYLKMVESLCLDSANITEDKNNCPISITDKETGEIIQTHFMKQDSKALLPSLVKDLLKEKQKTKDLLKDTDLNSPDYKGIKDKYEAVKSVVLTAWGIFGNRHFRLYDTRISGMITSCVRELLSFVMKKIKKNYELLGFDTDSLFVKGKKDILDLLNKLVKQWGKKSYNKVMDIEFEIKHNFLQIIFLGTCHYVGLVKTKKGMKKVFKGVEIIRSSSAEFEAKFQEKLIDKIFAKESKEKIVKWIKSELKRIEKVPIIEMAIPARLATPIDEYQTFLTRKQKDGSYKQFPKKLPIHVRALQGSPLRQEIKKLFYWVYLTEKRIMAFDEDNQSHINKDEIDYKKMQERNILNKARVIFNAMKWESKLFPVKVRKQKAKLSKSAQNPLQDSPEMIKKDKTRKSITEIDQNDNNVSEPTETKEVIAYYEE